MPNQHNARPWPFFQCCITNNEMINKIIKFVFLLGFVAWFIFAMFSTCFFEFFKSLFFCFCALFGLFLWGCFDDYPKDGNGNENG